jgi:tape measure domain-containing protein
MSVQQIYIRLATDVSGIQKAEAALENLTKEEKEVIAQFRKMGQEGNKATQSITGGLNGLSGTVTKIGGAIAASAIVKQVYDMGKAALVSAAEYEQLKISFTTMLGSAEKADKLLAKLAGFADVTPFDTDQVNRVSQSLLSFGFSAEQLIPTLTKVGNVSAGTKKDFGELAVIYGQVKVAGRLMGGELLQLTQAGVPIIKELAKNMGVAETQIKGMSEAGKIGFKDVEKAFETMSGEGGIFFNLMEKQSASTFGKWSTFESLLGKIAKNFGGDLLSSANVVIDVLSQIAEDFVSLSESDLDVFKKQKEQVDELEKSIAPLINRYDELKGQSTLTEAEQDELNDTIQKIGVSIPTAISGFDEYGKAMGISSDKAREFIATQQAILEQKNKDAIAEQTDALKDLDREIIKIQATLAKGSISLDMGMGVRTEAKLTGEDITKLQAKLSDLQKQKLGVSGWIDELKGVRQATEETAATTDQVTEAQKGLIEQLEENLKNYGEQLKKAPSLADTIGADGKTVEGINTINAKIKETQAQLDSLLGKTAEKIRQAREEYEKLTSALGQGEDMTGLRSTYDTFFKLIEDIKTKGKEAGKSTAEINSAIAKAEFDLSEKLNREGFKNQISYQQQVNKAREDAASKAVNIEKNRNDAIAKNFEQSQKALNEIRRQADSEEQEAQQKKAAIIEESIKLFTSLGNAYFESQANKRAEELSRLQSDKEKELQLVGNNEQAKNFINEKFARQEAALKTKQAKAEKERAMFNIVLSTAEAIAKAIAASVKTFGLPFSAFAAAQGGIQLALAASKPIPKFRKGIEWLDRMGNPKGVDTIPIMANEGERIVATEENSKIPRHVKNKDLPRLVKQGLAIESLSFITHKRAMEDFMEGLSRYEPMQLRSLRSFPTEPFRLRSIAPIKEPFRVRQLVDPAAFMPGLDKHYARLEKHIDLMRQEVAQLNDNLKNSPKHITEINERGLKKFIETANKRIEIINNQFPD